ncbi:MAG: hypothetical protein ACOC7U_03255 [Spirochaetota bacterium]
MGIKMKNYSLKSSMVSAVIFIFFAGPGFAEQELGSGAPAGPSQNEVTQSQSMTPGEPDIVLPSVVLELEDLSVGEITAKKLEPAELPPPRLETPPLPQPDDLEIETPFSELIAPHTEAMGISQDQERTLMAEGVLGTGTLNHFTSSISLYQFGKQPEGKLLFSHEMVDGLSGNPPGSGYNIREDILNGSLKFEKDKVELDTGGSFSDIETGLQGKGSFYSKINRSIEGSAEMQYQPFSRLFLQGDLRAYSWTQMLTRSEDTTQTNRKGNELYLSSSLEGKFVFEKGYLGLSPAYTYRTVIDRPGLELNRVRVDGLLGFDIAQIYTVDTRVGWFWSETTGGLVPFKVSFQATPRELFSVTAEAGYRVNQYNLSGLTEQFRWMEIPDSVEDDHGWFANIHSDLNLFRDWVFTGGLGLYSRSSIPQVVPGINTDTGLFTITQKQGLSLEADLGARWNISENFSANFTWNSRMIDRADYLPGNKLVVEASGVNKKGKYGGGGFLKLLTGVNDTVQAPVVGVNGFYRITRFFRLEADLNDLLYPLLDAPRYEYEPFVDTGFMITLSAHINF